MPRACVLLRAFALLAAVLLCAPGAAPAGSPPARDLANRTVPGPDRSAPPLADTLCLPGERVVFHCRTKETERLLSVCATPGLDRRSGRLAYRFGTRGHVELEYPKGGAAPQSRFSYDRVSGPDVNFVKLFFRIGQYGYTVYDEYMADGNSTLQSQGVSVRLPSGRVVDLECEAGGFSELMGLENVLGK